MEIERVNNHDSAIFNESALAKKKLKKEIKNLTNFHSFTYLNVISQSKISLTHRGRTFNKKNSLLFCSECGYLHPTDTGLDEGDFCPNCGNGILVEV